MLEFCFSNDKVEIDRIDFFPLIHFSVLWTKRQRTALALLYYLRNNEFIDQKMKLASVFVSLATFFQIKKSFEEKNMKIYLFVTNEFTRVHFKKDHPIQIHLGLYSSKPL